MDFVGSHILSVSQFQRKDGQSLQNSRRNPSRSQRVTVSEAYLEYVFEPSTRTRVSFGSAWNLLGGGKRTAEVTRPQSQKVSHFTMARVLSGYSDAIVMRHQIEGSVEEFAASRVPVINGGDGSNTPARLC